MRIANLMKIECSYSAIQKPRNLEKLDEAATGLPVQRPLFLHFDHRDAGADAAPFGWMVEARSLRMALNARLHDLPTLRLFAPAEATVERSAEGAVVRIAGGAEIAARLVVAAEGRTSPLREQAGRDDERSADDLRGG